MDNNKILTIDMTDSRRLVVKIFFVCLLLISLFLFLYTSNVIPFFKANWDPPKNEVGVAGSFYCFFNDLKRHSINRNVF